MSDLIGPFDSVPWSQSQWYQFAPLWSATGILGSPPGAVSAGPFGVTASGLGVTVTCAGQRAWVRGSGYQPDTDKTITVTANSNASLSRRDRLVIRRNLSTQTTTVERLTGTAGSNPSPPALTQIETGIWEMPICSFLVPPNNGTALSGFVDERVWVDPSINPRDLSNRIGAVESTVGTPTSADTAGAIVRRDANGNFSAGTITGGDAPTAAGHLTRKDYADSLDSRVASSIVSASGGTVATNASIITRAVTVPAGLASHKRIKVTAVVHVVTPAGVGVDLDLTCTGSSTSSATRSINVGSRSGDFTIFLIDTDLSSGARTYSLSVGPTVNNTQIDWRAPQMIVEYV